MPRLHALLAVVLLALAPGVRAADIPDDGWVSAAKARSPSDISLWTRMVPGAELKAFRSATQVRIPLESMLAFLYDTTAMPEWVFRCKRARILSENPDGSVLVHMQINGIWPLQDRDAVIRITPRIDESTGEINLVGTAEPTQLPEQPGYIRIPSIESSWRMLPLAEGRLRVEWYGHVDPGGSVPRWLANSVVTLVPRYTLKHMHEQLEHPKWVKPAQRDLGRMLLERARAATAH